MEISFLVKHMLAEKFKIIPTVYLILMKDNKILLSRRYNTGFHDGEYSFPAGHLTENETLIQAIIREAKEEIGIKVNPEDLKLIHVIHRKKEKDREEDRINFFFIAKKWAGAPKIMEPYKCDDLDWFPFNKLPKNIIPYIRQTIESFKNNVFYSEFGWKE